MFGISPRGWVCAPKYDLLAPMIDPTCLQLRAGAAPVPYSSSAMSPPRVCVYGAREGLNAPGNLIYLERKLDCSATVPLPCSTSAMSYLTYSCPIPSFSAKVPAIYFGAFCGRAWSDVSDGESVMGSWNEWWVMNWELNPIPWNLFRISRNFRLYISPIPVAAPTALEYR